MKVLLSAHKESYLLKTIVSNTKDGQPMSATWLKIHFWQNMTPSLTPYLIWPLINLDVLNFEIFNGYRFILSTSSGCPVNRSVTSLDLSRDGLKIGTRVINGDNMKSPPELYSRLRVRLRIGKSELSGRKTILLNLTSNNLKSLEMNHNWWVINNEFVQVGMNF